MKSDEGAVLDILHAARLIAGFNRDGNRESFLGDSMRKAATLHEFIVLGEAVKRLSDRFRTAHPELPWKEIAGLRDVAVHNYDEVDLEEIWRTPTDDIPALITFLERVAPQRPG